MTIIDEYLYQQEKYGKLYGASNTIVFMQVGSFFESYATETRGFNLKELSEVLNIMCTKKSKKIKEVSMKNPYVLGFPEVAYDKYIKLLMSRGYIIVVFSQTTPPPDPKRELYQIYSPATYIVESFTPDSNYILSLYIEDEKQVSGNFIICIGMTIADLSTGNSVIYEVTSTYDDDSLACDEAIRFINSYNPKEILIYRKKVNKDIQNNNYFTKAKLISYLELDDKNYMYTETVESKWSKISYQNSMLHKIFPDTGIYDTSIEYLDLENKNYARISFLLLIDYAYQHNENLIKKLHKPEIYIADKHLLLGNNALYQLNILGTQDFSQKSKFKNLFDVVNKTSTSLGRRYLKNRLINPYVDPEILNTQYDITETIIKNKYEKQINQYLYGIIDIERLNKKLAVQIIHPCEFINFITSLQQILQLISFLKKSKCNKIIPPNDICDQLKKFIALMEKSYIFDVAAQYNINSIESNIFNKGLYQEIDKVQNKIDDCEKFMDNICVVLSNYINEPKKKTVKKISKKQKLNENKQDDPDNQDDIDDPDTMIHMKNNKIDGYYLSATKIRANLLKKNLPDKIKITDSHIINKNSIKFKELAKGNTKIIFDELSNKSDELVELKQNIMVLTKDKYIDVLKKYYDEYGFMLRKIIEFVSYIDFLKSNAMVAVEYNYCKPKITIKSKSFVNCKQLRHAIIERNNINSEYIPHDICLGKDKLDGMLIFGFNYSGKSVLMKAVGMSVIMAQAGMYVPALNYEFSPYQSLFARITGNDNIFKGLSSFTLEMTELKAILKRTNKNTLVIGDEVCRGTEHISGNALVASALVQLSESKASFMFATHLHDIPKLDEIKCLDNMKPYHLTVEHDTNTDTLVFDRKLKEGSGDSIYGIIVAKYIIDDAKFIKRAELIRNKLLNKPEEFFSEKKSKYNSELYMDHCGVCKKKFNKSITCTGYLDTHHINHQKDCKDGFVIAKQHIKMNAKCNMVPLCKLCHNKVHSNKLLINGYKKTSNGIKLSFTDDVG